MNHLDDLFREQSMDHPLPDGFETQVFARIETRKRQRRAAVVTVVASAALGVGFAMWLILPRTASRPVMRADAPVSVEKRKEVVPVMEDVVFSASDGQTHYAVEQVNLQEEAEL